jgi:predicted RNA-binding protein associated with RNAse of E/G family
LKLLFINLNAYQKYRNFIKKKHELANYELLKLIYSITYNNNYNEYYFDVYIKNISENELNQFNNLKIDFILEQVSN